MELIDRWIQAVELDRKTEKTKEQMGTIEKD